MSNVVYLLILVDFDYSRTIGVFDDYDLAIKEFNKCVEILKKQELEAKEYWNKEGEEYEIREGNFYNTSEFIAFDIGYDSVKLKTVELNRVF